MGQETHLFSGHFVWLGFGIFDLITFFLEELRVGLGERVFEGLEEFGGDIPGMSLNWTTNKGDMQLGV